MSDSILIGVISGSAAIFVASLTVIANYRIQAAALWRDQKLSYYRSMIDGFASTVLGDVTPEDLVESARASNKVLLVGSKEVIAALHAYRSHLAIPNYQNRDQTLDHHLFADLIKAVRKDLKMPGKDDVIPEQMKFWTSGVKRKIGSDL
jgi:hypothetical protein